MRRSAALAALLAVAGTTIVWLAVAWSTAVLDSSSMEPWASPGDLLVHRIEPAGEIEVDDVVTVRVPERGLVTHRVIAVQDATDGRSVALMGDASRLPDPAPVMLPEEVERVALVIPRLGTAVRVGGPWLLGAILLLVMGVLALALARRYQPTSGAAADARGVMEPGPTNPVDPRVEALLATAEQLEEDGLPALVVADLVRVRTAAIVGLPPAEGSGAVLSLDDGGRFYVVAAADADPAMLGLVPVGSRRRRRGTAALDRWWDAVIDGLDPTVAAVVAPWLDPT